MIFPNRLASILFRVLVFSKKGVIFLGSKDAFF